MDVWFCNCLLVSLGNGLILTGCSWLLRAECSLRFQLIWMYWELHFGPAYVVFARNSSQAGLALQTARGVTVLLRSIMLACGKSLLSPVFALGCSLSGTVDSSGVYV